MNKFVFGFSFLMVMTMTACQQVPKTLEEFIHANDVEGAILQAKQNGDFKVLIAPLRAPVAPGISRDEMNMIKEKCGSTMLPGVSDVKTPENADTIKQAMEFAKAYNVEILSLCMNKD